MSLFVGGGEGIGQNISGVYLPVAETIQWLQRSQTNRPLGMGAHQVLFQWMLFQTQYLQKHILQNISQSPKVSLEKMFPIDKWVWAILHITSQSWKFTMHISILKVFVSSTNGETIFPLTMIPQTYLTLQLFIYLTIDAQIIHWVLSHSNHNASILHVLTH